MTMYVDADTRGNGPLRRELAQKIDGALVLLQAEVEPERYHRVVTFVEVLRNHTPLSYVVSLSERQLADGVLAFASFLDRRQGPVAVRLLPLVRKGHYLLLTCAADVPFLVDSVLSFLSQQLLRFQLVSHPILTIHRKDGVMTHMGRVDEKGPHESFVIVELEGLPAEECARLSGGVAEVITAAQQVHRDRKPLLKKLGLLVPPGEPDSLRDFFSWLRKDNFYPFSYRCLQVREGRPGQITLRELPGSALGLSGEPKEPLCATETPLGDFDPSFRERILRQGRIAVEATGRPSPILRAEPLVYLGFREPLEGGGWLEHAFLGLFSGQSMDELAFNVPTLRHRIEGALEALGVPKGCHDYRKAIEIFNSFPKVELFFMEPGELAEAVRSFSLLFRRDSVKVVPARGLAARGLTLLVLMPQQYYSTDTMGRFEAYLRRYFKADAASSRIIHISSDYLSLHVRIRPGGEEVQLDIDRLERGLSNLVRPWDLKLRFLLDRDFGENGGGALWQKYNSAFSREYRALVHPRFAIRDVRGVERVLSSGEEAFELWGPFGHRDQHYRIQFYSLRESYLNDLMPFLENLNLCVIEEVDFSLTVAGTGVFIKSFAVRGPSGATRTLSELRPRLLEALDALRRGAAENDYLNRLLVLTGLSWHDIDVFRGYRNYYFQLGSPYTKRRVAFALINNPMVALLLFRYFSARFRDDPRWQDPVLREEEALSPVRMELAAALEGVSDINEDSILRTLFNLIDSTVRTNFFLRRDQPEYFFAFKISAIGIIDMPAPRPLFEIYVHSSTMEGIHLRGGTVARGGIRWSDRPDDFRTEILGLMKTQMTKNALIVPVGSKGGFVVKTPYATREEGGGLAKAAYQTLMRGLLDLTDNRVADAVVRPPGVVAYDEEDPYLVVAADKGTAHLPDTANAVSREYGFWLDDAFASGGSRGYDHKRLGITARGAWECVKAHFREMGTDIQSEPFTVVGIGDMSGDVFGNGMLLSRQIRLLAAFDHRHIFLDPDPDAESSFLERQRLYALPRSSWDDYDRSLISEGGGVYPRDAKDIPLSSPVRRWLGVRHESMDGQGLVRLLLSAPADLLWNGGIGTYVKASSEKHEDAGDRANDAVRVDASQLRARVVGEGGNLGFTQRGRVEYALAGGRINTDAVDNSAGVDCSDHEVNLKILMQHLRGKGLLSAPEDRDRLLEAVTDEVCRTVLANNYGQSLCLSLDRSRCAADVDPFLTLADRLSAVGLLDRRGEFLPSAKEVLARGGGGFTRPELAILMAYSKMQLYQALLESDLPEREGVRDFLYRYFPEGIRSPFREHLAGHPLAREITATMITNAVVNQAGSAAINALASHTGVSPVEAAALYLAMDRIVGGQNLRSQIHAFDNRLPAQRQHALLCRLEDTLVALCLRAIEHDVAVPLEDQAISSFSGQARDFAGNLGGILSEAEWQECQACSAALEEEGLPPEAALNFTALPYLQDFIPVVSLSTQTGGDLYTAARTLNEVRDVLGLKALLQRMEQVPLRDRWDRMALHSLKGEVASVSFKLACAVLLEAKGDPDAYLARRRQKLGFYRALRDGLAAAPANYHPFTVLLRALDALLDHAAA